MNIWDKARILFSNNFNERIKEFYNGDDDLNNVGMNIDSETAMRYSAVFACVRVLAETVASLPIKLYQKLDNGDKREANDLGLYDVLHSAPNMEMTPFNFKESMMTSLCLGGNAFAQKVYDKQKNVVGLYPLDWQKIRIVRKNNELIYEYQKETEWVPYTRKEIFHIPGLSLNGINGLTPIGYAAKSIELGLTYEAFCIQFYKNGANSSMMLRHPKVMKEDAYMRLKSSFTEKYTGTANTNKPIILEDGMDITQLTINPVDAQLLESKNFQIEDICRIYRVPQHLVNKLDRSTNNNIEHQSLEFVMYTMLPWFKRIEENMNLQLLTPVQRLDGYYAEFVVDALLRGDNASRSAAYAAGRQWGWFSVNDIRRKENQDTIENGDIYLQPSNMVEAGTIPDPVPDVVETPTQDEEMAAKLKQNKDIETMIFDILLEKGVIQ